MMIKSVWFLGFLISLLVTVAGVGILSIGLICPGAGLIALIGLVAVVSGGAGVVRCSAGMEQ